MNIHKDTKYTYESLYSAKNRNKIIRDCVLCSIEKELETHFREFHFHLVYTYRARGFLRISLNPLEISGPEIFQISSKFVQYSTVVRSFCVKPIHSRKLSSLLVGV